MRNFFEGCGDPLSAIVGESVGIKKVRSIVRQVACGDFPVLLEGETGTGKELVARVIHALSDRKDKPFIPVNCGAIPADLMESEFFGYRKGAYTGATGESHGLFGEADGGILFLDEIVEMPVQLQVKLLRAIEDSEIKRLGDTRYTRVDVRIIAATNKNVEEALKRGELRKDLYYRISCVRIKLSPLRERKDDIPLLVEHFIEKFNRKYDRKIKGLTARAMDSLLYYDWPGNVRELENVIKRAYALGKGDTIEIGDIPRYIWDGNENFPPDFLSVEEAEKKAILQALKASGGNKTRAAKLLGIGRKTLYDKMKKYGLFPAGYSSRESS